MSALGISGFSSSCNPLEHHANTIRCAPLTSDTTATQRIGHTATQPVTRNVLYVVLQSKQNPLPNEATWSISDALLNGQARVGLPPPPTYDAVYNGPVKSKLRQPLARTTAPRPVAASDNLNIQWSSRRGRGKFTGTPLYMQIYCLNRTLIDHRVKTLTSRH
jgi:hypothetical protein